MNAWIAGGLLGAVLGTGIYSLSHLHGFVAKDFARVYVTSNCGPSRATLELVEASTSPVVVIPLDYEDSAFNLRACARTLQTLETGGLYYRVLRLLPDSVLCRRLNNGGRRWWREYNDEEGVPLWVDYSRNISILGLTPEAREAFGF